MRVPSIALSFVLAAWAAGAVPALADSLVVSNGTDGEVVSLFVSDLGGAKWGPDQLDEPLEPGAKITLKDLEPGLHRIRIIDEDDSECIIDNVPVKDGNTWTITDDALDECQAPDTPGKGASLARTRVHVALALPAPEHRPSSKE
jgi:hypothetical protein